MGMREGSVDVVSKDARPTNMGYRVGRLRGRSLIKPLGSLIWTADDINSK